MPTVRQLASGIVYAVVSLLLVIGSLALALAQGRAPGAPISEATALPTNTVTRFPTAPSTTFEWPSATKSATPPATRVAPTATYFFPTVPALPQRTATSIRACGPYPGWVRGYVVQPGDTQFRIATMHGTTVEMLQRANCKTGTLIYAGERLWVPFLLPPPTELTIIPTFDTPTEPATSTASGMPTATASETQDP